MTPRTFLRLQKARMKEEERQRHLRANEIIALIYGFRVPKRVNLRSIYKDLVGGRKPPDDLKPLRWMIEESRARVRRKKRQRELRNAKQIEQPSVPQADPVERS